MIFTGRRARRISAVVLGGVLLAGCEANEAGPVQPGPPADPTFGNESVEPSGAPTSPLAASTAASATATAAAPSTTHAPETLAGPPPPNVQTPQIAQLQGPDAAATLIGVYKKECNGVYADFPFDNGVTLRVFAGVPKGQPYKGNNEILAMKLVADARVPVEDTVVGGKIDESAKPPMAGANIARGENDPFTPLDGTRDLTKAQIHRLVNLQGGTPFVVSWRMDKGGLDYPFGGSFLLIRAEDGPQTTFAIDGAQGDGVASDPIRISDQVLCPAAPSTETLTQTVGS